MVVSFQPGKGQLGAERGIRSWQLGKEGWKEEREREINVFKRRRKKIWGSQMVE